MATLLRPASTRGERDASARSLNVVGLAARKEGRTASPSPALPFGSRQPKLQGRWRDPRRVQPKPSPPQQGLADGSATVDQTREQLALFPTVSLVLLGMLALQLLRTLALCCAKLPPKGTRQREQANGRDDRTLRGRSDRRDLSGRARGQRGCQEDLRPQRRSVSVLAPGRHSR